MNDCLKIQLDKDLWISFNFLYTSFYSTTTSFEVGGKKRLNLFVLNQYQHKTSDQIDTTVLNEQETLPSDYQASQESDWILLSTNNNGLASLKTSDEAVKMINLSIYRRDQREYTRISPLTSKTGSVNNTTAMIT
ncbi:uncharacterized protein PGTG_01386 [Puccinia graminis f. sp. tritici CRL 75-36-700-3]|uniref:Uncharacterized protein n=1 Tax=Puccinia graminis f. sp. tritici (strain CRL 75-36-700-3 / race SCCL) TaxID=418459 RepID=E3JRW8_PUCGT|nr:uncharacterized protein PGTG_01386 [Puccinia graminis f. sp. tritici CRL 75-36-700-3]EFP74793.1 hypothetical protein PGTG_01386 [Puccinia graminis f. sp. tritici CRL 75-36-700-3]